MKIAKRLLCLLLVLCSLMSITVPAMATEAPTEVATEIPTEAATEVPTEAVTGAPTEAPTEVPTEAPTEVPTEAPAEVPTEAPTEDVNTSIEAKKYDNDSGAWYNLNWALSGGTLTITGSGEMHEVSYSEYPWYQYVGQIMKIVVGNYVDKISGDAFYGQSGVTSVSIGSSVKSIGNRAFYNCTSLKSVKIPASVKQIGNTAFRYCSNLESVNFATGSQMTSLLYATFRDCKKLVSVTLPDGLTSIGWGAFAGCSNLSSISLGSQLKTIGESAFESCAKLQEVEFPASIQSIDKYAFYGCKSLSSVDLPDGLETLGDYAFAHCTALSGFVKIPATVTNWGQCTFINSNLQEVAIYAPRDVGSSAFQNCKNLTRVTIGDGVTGIGGDAFSNTALSEVALPDSVTHIGSSAFNHCTALHTVKFSSGLTNLGMNAFDGSAITSAILPDSVTSIGVDCFQNCTALTTVKLGSGIMEIPNYAFQNCSGLKSVTLNNSITQIGVYAFNGCKSLTTINWPESLDEIGERAFQNCDALISITLPSSLRYIDTGAFGHCNLLESVTLLSKDYAKIKTKSFTNCPSLVKFKTYSTNTQYEDFDADVFYDTPSVTIYGWAGTASEKYASENNIPFVAITGLDAPVPRKIQNTVSGIHVYWNPAEFAATYSLYRATSANGTYNLVKSGIKATHYTDTTVSSGKSYFYKVVSCNGPYGSGKSDAIGITFVSTPDITSRINKVAGIKLEWNKITGATGYAIYRKSYSGTDAWVRVKTITSGSTLTWTDESVKNNNGTAYRYTVRALAGSNRTILSGCRNTGRTMVRLCSQVMTSAAKTSSTSIKCAWTTSSKVTGYEVRFVVNGSVYKTVTIGNYATGVKTFTGLKAGQTYQIQVRTYKKVSGVGSFYSAWSEAKYITL